MRKLIALCAITRVTGAAATYAAVHHAQLVQSTPADGSASDTAPASFVLEFSEAVRFAPPLAAGHYTLESSVFTRELTALSGHIGFTVGSAPPH
jgi:methionine-rich copper-binding protein CopC